MNMFDSEPLLTEALLVAVAAAVPLAARTRLCLADRGLPGRSPGRPRRPRRVSRCVGTACDRQLGPPGDRKFPSGGTRPA
jgi:hypothetical protein